MKFDVRTLAALADGQLLSTAFWAPEGDALVYVLKNDIYYHRLNGNSMETRRVTFDGKPQTIYNGVPDWVYEGKDKDSLYYVSRWTINIESDCKLIWLFSIEEVYGGDRAMWFSPNAEYLAFATFNDSQVPEALITRYGKPGSLKDQYPNEEKFRYPKVSSL